MAARAEARLSVGGGADAQPDIRTIPLSHAAVHAAGRDVPTLDLNIEILVDDSGLRYWARYLLESVRRRTQRAFCSCGDGRLASTAMNAKNPVAPCGQSQRRRLVKVMAGDVESLNGRTPNPREFAWIAGRGLHFFYFAGEVSGLPFSTVNTAINLAACAPANSSCTTPAGIRKDSPGVNDLAAWPTN